MEVWVVMERYQVDDDGDMAVEFEAVHATEAGALANLDPDYETSGFAPGSRERWCFEAELGP